MTPSTNMEKELFAKMNEKTREAGEYLFHLKRLHSSAKKILPIVKNQEDGESLGDILEFEDILEQVGSLLEDN